MHSSHGPLCFHSNHGHYFFTQQSQTTIFTQQSRATIFTQQSQTMIFTQQSQIRTLFSHSNHRHDSHTACNQRPPFLHSNHRLEHYFHTAITDTILTQHAIRDRHSYTYNYYNYFVVVVVVVSQTGYGNQKRYCCITWLLLSMHEVRIWTRRATVFAAGKRKTLRHGRYMMS